MTPLGLRALQSLIQTQEARLTELRAAHRRALEDCRDDTDGSIGQSASACTEAEARLLQLQDALEGAVLAQPSGERVEPGTVVTVVTGGRTLKVLVVDPLEAECLGRSVGDLQVASENSPIGMALLAAQEGNRCLLNLGGGRPQQWLKIQQIETVPEAVPAPGLAS